MPYRGRLEMSTALVAVVNVAMAGACGYGIYLLARPKSDLLTPLEVGRKWFAWVAMIQTTAILPPFFRAFQPVFLVNWVVGLIVFGGLAFAGGWVYARFLRSTPSTSKRTKAELAEPASVPLRAGAIRQERTASIVTSAAQAAASDDFKQAAAAELSRGYIDEPLWQRIISQVENDIELAKEAYLQARATAILEADRQARWAEAARATRATQVAEVASRQPMAITSARATDPSDSSRGEAGVSEQPHPAVMNSNEIQQHRLLKVGSQRMMWIVLAYFVGVCAIGLVLASSLA